MTTFSAFSRAIILPGTIDNGGDGDNLNKFLPGNYMEIANTGSARANQWNTPGNNSPSTRGVLQRLQADPNGHWKGVMLRFLWTELEGNELGDYTAGIALIHSYLNQLAAYPGRRLMIFIAFKTFGASINAVPFYMRNSSVYADGKDYYTTRNGVRNQGSFNGQYAYESSNGGPGGFVPNMQVAAVRERYKALMQAYALEFNDHPALEAIVMAEAAVAQPIGSIGAANETVNGVVITRPNTDGGSWSGLNAWYNNMADGLINAKVHWSHTQISQWVNSPRSNMKTWVPTIRAGGIGLGMTDLCRLDKGFNYRSDLPGLSGENPGNIQHCQESNGLAIITGHMSQPAMNGSVTARNQTAGTIQQRPEVYPLYPGTCETRQQVFDWAVNIVGCTHVIWVHNTSNHPAAGTKDPNAPSSSGTYTSISDSYTGTYNGKSHNLATDNWIHNSPNILTNETRYTGW